MKGWLRSLLAACLLVPAAAAGEEQARDPDVVVRISGRGTIANNRAQTALGNERIRTTQGHEDKWVVVSLEELRSFLAESKLVASRLANLEPKRPSGVVCGIEFDERAPWVQVDWVVCVMLQNYLPRIRRRERKPRGEPRPWIRTYFPSRSEFAVSTEDPGDHPARRVVRLRRGDEGRILAIGTERYENRAKLLEALPVLAKRAQFDVADMQIKVCADATIPARDVASLVSAIREAGVRRVWCYSGHMAPPELHEVKAFPMDSDEIVKLAGEPGSSPRVWWKFEEK